MSDRSESNSDRARRGVDALLVARDAETLTSAELALRHGRGFLVSYATPSAHARAPGATIAVNFDAVPSTNEVNLRAFPIRRRPHADYPFVCVGRLDNNDIVFPDETISKFHAFIREEADGFFLQDAKSRNGTFVDGTLVAVRGLGPPTLLRNGASVRFGSVTTGFYDIEALVDLIRRR